LKFHICSIQDFLTIHRQKVFFYYTNKFQEVSKMRVHVLGKQFVSGKSKKTGKDFAANVVDVCFQRNGVEGYATDRIWLDPKEYPLDSIVLDKDYNVDYDFRGYILGFTPPEQRDGAGGGGGPPPPPASVQG